MYNYILTLHNSTFLLYIKQKTANQGGLNINKQLALGRIFCFRQPVFIGV